ncbi:MAG: hypothetical protein H7251_16010 [Acetobacteraceae bacterium]|nr:hypothetical protein [Acetobacteraceae bacterium]
MAEVSQEDIERLAARVAMLVSEDGEAANAGRAVGQLARRLGLSGGDLKQLFLNGTLGPTRKPRPAEPAGATQEIATLRRNLRRLETIIENLQDERDQLVNEAGQFRVAMYQARARRRQNMVIAGVGAVVLLVVVTVVGFADFGGGRRPPAIVEAAAPWKPATGTSATVRSARGTLYSQADPTSSPVIYLPAGTKVQVRRVLWNMMTQWAEVETLGKSGFVPMTEIDLF